MSVELTMLLYSVIFMFVLIAIPATVAILANGLTAQAGPRDTLPEPSVFFKRADRLRANMIENMMLFAPLVLIANAMDISTAITVLGAQLFFFARLLHAVIYLAGWPMVRPLIYFVGLAGCIMIAVSIL